MQNCKFTPNHLESFVSVFTPHTPYNTTPHSLGFGFIYLRAVFSSIVWVSIVRDMLCLPPPFVFSFSISFFYSIDFFFHFFVHKTKEFLSSYVVHAFIFSASVFSPSILLIFFSLFCTLFSHTHHFISLLFFILNGKNLHARYQRCMFNNTKCG